MAVTIKELAKKAGVSTATVSMILNKKDHNISEATRAKVLAIAEELHYIPNTMARSLVTRRTRTIGLILPDITNPFFPEIARGVEDRASKSRYSVILCNTDDNAARESQCAKILAEKMVDGIIFAHSGEQDQIPAGLRGGELPIVLLDRDTEDVNIKGRVLVDNRKGSYAAVKHLIGCGCRRILYISGCLNTRTAQDRLNGYRDALLEHGLEYGEDLVKSNSYRMEWGWQAMDEFLEEGKPFDGLFCGNDLIAIGAIRRLREQGCRIPEDVCVAGFDDIYLASMVEPPLTTVKQPIYEMGYQSAELLIRQIEKKNGQARIVLEPELILRGTTTSRREPLD